MNLAAVIEKIPIETDEDGVIRVGNTRVTLETLVSAFNNGSTGAPIGLVHNAGNYLPALVKSLTLARFRFLAGCVYLLRQHLLSAIF